MLKRCCAVGMLAWVTVVLIPASASAQSYPIKPVRIVTAEAGGGNDLVARLLAQGLNAPLGQQVIVENRGGASGGVAAQAVAKAPPDGYMLLLYSSALWIVPLIEEVSWDTSRDFTPVTLAAAAPNILVVHPSLPVKSVKELIALARARPGALNYATGATGSSGHLSGELLKSMAQIDMVRITYKGTAPALTDLMGGQVQLMFPAAGAVMSHIKSGRLRALAVTGAKPSALTPGIPTVAASGLPGYESTSVYGVFAPAKTPAAIVSRLNQEMVRVLHTSDVKEKLFNAGVEPVGTTPEEFGATVKADIARMGKILKDTKLRER